MLATPAHCPFLDTARPAAGAGVFETSRQGPAGAGAPAPVSAPGAAFTLARIGTGRAAMMDAGGPFPGPRGPSSIAGPGGMLASMNDRDAGGVLAKRQGRRGLARLRA